MFTLLLINLPYNASHGEIREWIESRGVEITSIRILRHIDGVSPVFGHVELNGSIAPNEAISILHGKKIRNQKVLVREVPACGRGKHTQFKQDLKTF